MALKTQQRGLSFIGLLFVGCVVAFLGIVLAQAVPTYMEYREIGRAATQASNGTTVGEVRQIFDKAADINEITSISGKDLDITKQGDKVIVAFAYNKEIHLMGPAYLLLKYSGQSR